VGGWKTGNSPDPKTSHGGGSSAYTSVRPPTNSYTGSSGKAVRRWESQEDPSQEDAAKENAAKENAAKENAAKENLN